MYRVDLQIHARRQMDKVHGNKDFDRIAAAILSLRENPRPFGVKKLKNSIYRIRTGNWRTIYSLDDREKAVLIGRIARRSEDTYNGVEDLF
jgi:mRNA-degrading endonuclease RelE of RelBE toxin-antitoxin system